MLYTGWLMKRTKDQTKYAGIRPIRRWSICSRLFFNSKSSSIVPDGFRYVCACERVYVTYIYIYIRRTQVYGERDERGEINKRNVYIVALYVDYSSEIKLAKIKIKVATHGQQLVSFVTYRRYSQLDEVGIMLSNCTTAGVDPFKKQQIQ